MAGSEQGTEQGEGLDVFLNRIGTALKTQLPGSYWVRAEILKADTSKGNHLSLELASYDGSQGAKARAWIWSSNINIVSSFEQSTGSSLKAGLKILFQCRVQFHPEFGLSLVIENIDPKFTLGDMEAKLQAIRERLTSLNEINRNRYLDKPKDFCRVAVVSPESAAGLGDFKTIADRLEKYNLCEFNYYPSLFQGANAVASIVSAISQVVVDIANGNQYDALAIVRGGGDKAGLYQLNEIKIARCICRSPIPVLVGIGHERDSTILDEVANCRLATPSLVASFIQEAIVKNARDAKFNYELLVRSSQSISSFAKQELRDYRANISLLSHKKLESARRQVTEHNTSLTHVPNLLIQNAKRQNEENYINIKLLSGRSIQQAKELVSESFRSAINDTKVNIRSIGSHIQQLKIDVIQRAHHSTSTAKSSVQHYNIQMRQGASNSAHQAKSSVLYKYEESLKATKYYLGQQRNAIENESKSLRVNAAQSLTAIKSDIKILVERVLLLDPSKILAKGFALIMSNEKKVLTTKKDVLKQKNVSLRLKDGFVEAHILEDNHEQ